IVLSEEAKIMVRESTRNTAPGLMMLALFLLFPLLGGFNPVRGAEVRDGGGALLWTLLLIATLIALPGLFVVNPNEGRVLQLFGAYRGTVKVAGLRWANPFYTKRRISLRVRNFESQRLKVNDTDGNPIEIAA